MPRTTKPLTELEVRNAKPREKAYKLFDGNGLFLEVPSVGNRRWRFKYRFDGKEKLQSLGVYPEVTLVEAREKRDEARKSVRTGVDPGDAKKAKRTATAASMNREIPKQRLFRNVAQDWLENRRQTWSEDHVVRVRTSLENDVFPELGDRDIATITADEIIQVIKRVEARGALDVAARVAQRTANVFRHGFRMRLCPTNPAADLSGVVTQRKVKHRAALSRSDLPGFFAKLDHYDGRPETRLAVLLLMHTFVRTNELRGARWSEVDLDRHEWRVPADRMKMGAEHIVPLSTQVRGFLRELHKYTSHSALLFPGTGETDKPISENTVLFALYRLGFHSKATGHGMRTLASTNLNELGWRPDIIEKQLAHIEANKVRDAYNRAAYMPERRKMMQAYSDWLDEQRHGNVVSLSKKRTK